MKARALWVARKVLDDSKGLDDSMDEGARMGVHEVHILHTVGARKEVLITQGNHLKKRSLHYKRFGHPFSRALEGLTSLQVSKSYYYKRAFVFVRLSKCRICIPELAMSSLFLSLSLSLSFSLSQRLVLSNKSKRNSTILKHN